MKRGFSAHGEGGTRHHDTVGGCSTGGGAARAHAEPEAANVRGTLAMHAAVAGAKQPQKKAMRCGALACAMRDRRQRRGREHDAAVTTTRTRAVLLRGRERAQSRARAERPRGTSSLAQRLARHSVFCGY